MWYYAVVSVLCSFHWFTLRCRLLSWIWSRICCLCTCGVYLLSHSLSFAVNQVRLWPVLYHPFVARFVYRWIRFFIFCYRWVVKLSVGIKETLPAILCNDLAVAGFSVQLCHPPSVGVWDSRAFPVSLCHTSPLFRSSTVVWRARTVRRDRKKQFRDLASRMPLVQMLVPASGLCLSIQSRRTRFLQDLFSSLIGDICDCTR